MTHCVLLVDDDAALLDGLRRVLRSEPFDTLLASSGAEALDTLRSTSVDLIVCDQGMPDMSGTELLARSRTERPDTIRFMLTGNATLPMAIDAINDAAITRLFVKPCNPVELAMNIKQALSQRELFWRARDLLHKSRHQSAVLEDLEQRHPGITAASRAAIRALGLAELPSDDEELLREIARQVDGATDAA